MPLGRVSDASSARAASATWSVAPSERTGQFVSGAWTVEESEAKNDSPAAALCKPVGLTLGGQRGSQDRRNVADRGVFADETLAGVDEGDGRLHVSGDVGGERGVDQGSRGLCAKSVVIAPRLGVAELFERLDPSG